MGNIIEVNPNVLERDANAVLARLENVKKDIVRIENVMTALNGMWDGTAKRIYMANLMTERENLIESVHQAEQITKKMGEAVVIYRRCTNEVNQEIAEIRV